MNTHLRKLMVFTSLTLILIGTLGLMVKVQKVKASSTIYIKADGSITPIDAPITSIDNITYTLTNDFYGSIIVERNNIKVDGANHVIQGADAFDSKGIDIASRNNITIKHAKVKSFYFGIYLQLSSNSSIFRNDIENSNYGVWLSESTNNIISENNITDNKVGVLLNLFSSNNIVLRNRIADNTYGIRCDYVSEYNKILENTFANNQGGILLLWSSSGTHIYRNNFADNTIQVYVESSSSMNAWNDSVEGNYWSDYAGSDLNRDGIGDASYSIDFDNVDEHPLMGMFNSFNASADSYVNVISNSTITDFEYFVSDSKMRIQVSNATLNQTFSFCRISIPKVLLGNQYNVTIYNVTQYHVNYTLYENATHNWIYLDFQYATSEPKIIIIPEFNSFITLTLLMVTLFAIMLSKKKIVPAKR